MSLCPGYHPVTQFGPDDDYEEEEIFYITLELGQLLSLLGLGTPTPFLQLAGTALKGRHETLYGTAVRWCNFYILPTDHGVAVSYITSTRQRICFREVRLEEKAKTDACQFVLDRITGDLASLPRRRRTRKMEVVPEDY
ncbi:hypothetical protein IW261DRAFT_1519313, partial [Armillaria novae-zelandiae]